MSRTNGVGLSDESRHKYRHGDGLFQMVIRMAGGALHKNPWWAQRFVWFDITAGPGYHPTLSLYGTPMLAMKYLAKMKGVETYAVFVEENADNVAALRQVLADEYGPPVSSGPRFVEEGNYRVVHGDNRVWAKLWLEHTPPSHLGVITADPTGIVDFDVIAELATMPGRTNYDVLLYVSATSLKRVRRAGMRNLDVLTEEMKKCNKKLWIVRQPAGPFQWTWLIGTNWANMPAWEKAGFRLATSDEGRDYLERMAYTAEELLERQGEHDE